MRKYGKHSAAQTVQDKGFYIILILCAAAIAISGYVLFFAPLTSGTSMDGVEYTAAMPKEETAWSPASGDAAADASGALDASEDFLTESGVEQDSVLSDDSRLEETPVGQTDVTDTIPEEQPVVQTEPAPSETTANEPVQQTAAPVWVKPVDGEVVHAFSGDDLVYQQTFGDWRVHAGADYLAEAGARVYAVSDGTVAEVVDDALWGTCVTIQLSDGRTAIYRGLEQDPKVSVDSSVKAGDVIGTVASVVPAETEQGAHLHLEIRDADGVALDPEQITE